MERLFLERYVDSLAELFKAATTGALCVRAHLGTDQNALVGPHQFYGACNSAIVGFKLLVDREFANRPDRFIQ
jgi:hypothetical protein